MTSAALAQGLDDVTALVSAVLVGAGTPGGSDVNDTFDGILQEILTDRSRTVTAFCLLAGSYAATVHSLADHLGHDPFVIVRAARDWGAA